MQKQLIVGLLLVLLNMISNAAAEERVCTEMGCSQGLTISIPATYDWKVGDYRFDIAVDGKKVSCRGTLPLKACDTASISCETSSIEVGIVESGCALEPSAHGFGDISLPGGGGDVSLLIFHNGKQLAQGAWKPKYQESQPNGPGCPPLCRSAVVELRW